MNGCEHNVRAHSRYHSGHTYSRYRTVIILGAILCCLVQSVSPVLAVPFLRRLLGNPIDNVFIPQLEKALLKNSRSIPPPTIFRFARGEAPDKIGNLSMLATSFEPGIQNKGLIQLDPRDNQYLQEVFKVDYKLVGRYMGNIRDEKARSLTADVSLKYGTGFEIGFGPKFPGIGIEDSTGDIYVMLEYLQGLEFPFYEGPSISRGIVEALDRGVVGLATNHNALVLDAHPNNLIVQDLKDHPLGFKYTVRAYDWDVVDFNSAARLSLDQKFALGNTLGSRLRAMEAIRKRTRDSPRQRLYTRWTPFYVDLMQRVDPLFFQQFLRETYLP